jgi:hypothetical protein
MVEAVWPSLGVSPCHPLPYFQSMPLTYAHLGAPIAEFKVSKLVLILLHLLTVGAVFLGLTLGLAWAYALLSCQSAKERAVIAVVGAFTVVFIYLIHLRSNRPRSARDHLMAHLGHVLGIGYLIKSRTYI